jgi:hypothetical protein
VAAPRRANFSGGTSLGTNLLTGWPENNQMCQNQNDNNHKELLTDEQIRKLDVVPQILPDFFLGGTFNMNKITSDLDMRAIHNWQIGPELLYEWYEPWHLRIICHNAGNRTN